MASVAQWYLYAQGEVTGPLAQDLITLFLRQNRIQFADFVWRPGLSKWMRIQELTEFEGLMPPYPDAPLPEGAGASAAGGATPAKGQAAPPKPPKPTVRRHARAAIEGKVAIDGTEYPLINISETGLCFQGALAAERGVDVKMRLQSPSFEKVMDLTGVIVPDSQERGESTAIQFTRMNPAHKRVIQKYVETHADLSQ